ncbi:ATP-binding protein, partial [Streptomyces palmae]
MSIWWSLHLRREAASVPLARKLLLGTMETAGVDPEIAHDLSLALTEACANAVEHGGSEGAGENYRVTAFIDGDTCRIEVTDSGPGFTRSPGGCDHLAPGTGGRPA